MHIIGGHFRNRSLITPKGDEVRPTSARLREALFNICQTYIEEATFLDLFCGSGAMGLEALSRGAKHATFIDIAKESIRCTARNIEALGLKASSKVILGDVFIKIEKLAKEGKKYDIIYADPPYHSFFKEKNASFSAGQRLLQFLDQHDLLTAEGVLFIEEAKTAFEGAIKLENLTLRNARTMGRSTLHDYVKKPT